MLEHARQAAAAARTSPRARRARRTARTALQPGGAGVAGPAQQAQHEHDGERRHRELEEPGSSCCRSGSRRERTSAPKSRERRAQPGRPQQAARRRPARRRAPELGAAPVERSAAGAGREVRRAGRAARAAARASGRASRRALAAPRAAPGTTLARSLSGRSGPARAAHGSLLVSIAHVPAPKRRRPSLSLRPRPPRTRGSSSSRASGPSVAFADLAGLRRAGLGTLRRGAPRRWSRPRRPASSRCSRTTSSVSPSSCRARAASDRFPGEAPVPLGFHAPAALGRARGGRHRWRAVAALFGNWARAWRWGRRELRSLPARRAARAASTSSRGSASARASAARSPTWPASRTRWCARESRSGC